MTIHYEHKLDRFRSHTGRFVSRASGMKSSIARTEYRGWKGEIPLEVKLEDLQDALGIFHAPLAMDISADYFGSYIGDYIQDNESIVDQDDPYKAEE